MFKKLIYMGSIRMLVSTNKKQSVTLRSLENALSMRSILILRELDWVQSFSMETVNSRTRLVTAFCMKS